MRQEKLVSIIVTAFNAKKFIEKTIQSCLNQSYKNIELLVFDDASGDDTISVIKKISDSRIRLFENKKNIGPYLGLNFLLDMASGEYIAIQDHDDIWFPKKIEKQVSFLENNPKFIACGTNTFYYFEEKKIFFLKKTKSITDYVNHTSLVFRNKNLRYNPKLSLPESNFQREILLKKGLLGCIQENLTIHRIRLDGDNLSKKSRTNLKDKLLFFKHNGLSKGSLGLFFYIVLRIFVPDGLLWIWRSRITFRGSEKMTKHEFILKYPFINL